MASTRPRASSPRPTWPAVAAAAVGGIAIGTLSRNLPVSLAIAILPDQTRLECEDQGAFTCSFASMPVAIGEMLRLALVVAVFCAVLCGLGAVLLGIGAHRIRLARRLDSMPDSTSPSRRARSNRLGLGLIALGSCLVFPGFWLLGSFVAFLAR